MLELLTQNCNLIAESPDSHPYKQTAIYRRPVSGGHDYFIVTEDPCGDFLVAMLNDRDFEKGAFEIDGKDIIDLVKDGETTAADWASHNLIVTEA